VELAKNDLLCAFVEAVDRALDVNLALRILLLRRIRHRAPALDEPPVEDALTLALHGSVARLAATRAAPATDEEIELLQAGG
jgi:hypothetical protein